MTLDELAALRAARKDELDLPRTMTPREVAAYLEQTRVLDQRLAAARTASDTLAQVVPALEADTAWLANLNAWRETLSAELLAIKSPIRDRAVKEQADSLTWSIRVVDIGLSASTLGPVVALVARIGELMQAAGYETVAPALHGPRGWRGAIRETERRIAELTKRKAQADTVLAQMLLTDAEEAARDAQQDARREALNSMQIKHNNDGTGLVAFTLGGEPLPEAEMTDAQRHAFGSLA